jgi:hypothetical protein
LRIRGYGNRGDPIGGPLEGQVAPDSEPQRAGGRQIRQSPRRRTRAMLAFQMIGLALLALFFAAMISGTQDSGY